MKIKKNKYFLFSIIAFFLSLFVFVIVFLLNYSLILDEKEIPAILEVGEISAFNLDNSILSFGVISPKTTASRSFQISNNYSFPIVAYIGLRGNISRFLIFEDKIKLLSQEKKTLIITTISPTEEDYGNYSGRMIITLKREM